MILIFHGTVHENYRNLFDKYFEICALNYILKTYIS